MASLPTPTELDDPATAERRQYREQVLRYRAELESYRHATARVRAHCRAAGPLTSKLAARVLDLLGDLP
jgi:hypothetical protein